MSFDYVDADRKLKAAGKFGIKRAKRVELHKEELHKEQTF